MHTDPTVSKSIAGIAADPNPNPANRGRMCMVFARRHGERPLEMIFLRVGWALELAG